MTAKIAAAMHRVMSKVAYVQKTGNNKFHGYRYAGEADLLDKLRPAMIEAGLLLLPSIKSVSPIDEHGNVTVLMEYTLAHKDGEIWPEKIGAAGCGNDKNSKGGVGDKGVYKAITGANKYVLFKLFQIETGDDPEVDERLPEPEPEHNDEARSIFIRATREIIKSTTDAKALGEWWKSDEQKKQRRDFGLSEAEVKDLVAAVTARHNELTQKEAA